MNMNENKMDLERKTEQAILGACLIDSEAVKVSVERLKTETFLFEVHQIIFCNIVKMYQDSKPIDQVLLANAMTENKDLEKIGGSVYLCDLANSIPTTSNIPAYIETLLKQDEKRRLNEAIDKAYKEEDHEKKKAILSQAIKGIKVKEKLNPISCADFMKLELPAQDDYWGDGLLQPESRMLIGGASKAGKTMFALNLGICLAMGKPFLDYFIPKPIKVLMIQAEISKKNLQKRLMTMTAECGMPDNLYLETAKELKLDREEGLIEMQRLIESLKPEVVIIDPLANFHNKEENSATEIRVFTNNIDRLLEKYGTAFVITHHHKKPSQFEKNGFSQMRGSSVFTDWVDSILTINTHDKDAKTKSLEFTLRNASSPPMHILKMGDDLWHHRVSVEGESKVKDQMILEAIDEAGGTIPNQDLIRKVAEKSGASEGTIKTRLKAMEGKGITSIGERKKKVWTKLSLMQSTALSQPQIVDTNTPENLIDKAKNLFNGEYIDNSGIVDTGA
jgi:replicative DNA helicase